MIIKLLCFGECMSQARLDAEWITLNATREVLKLATNDFNQATYDKALAFGGELYPELLGL